MKNVLSLLLSFVLLLGLGGLVFSLSAGVNSPGKSDAEKNNINSEYTITYKAVTAGVIGDIPSSMFFNDEQVAEGVDAYYPKKYTSGSVTTIGTLKAKFDMPDGSTMSFNGWYLDKNLTTPFNGVITADYKSDLIVYADIVIGQKYTITYKSVLDGVVQNIEHDPKDEQRFIGGMDYSVRPEMPKDINLYPREYVPGSVFYVGTLANIKSGQLTTEKFSGWYLDSACNNPFTEESCRTLTGNVILYAKYTTTP